MKKRRLHQGKTDDQLEFSEIACGLALIGMSFIFVWYFLYHTISSLIHYIMG